jgi:oligoribonuclease
MPTRLINTNRLGAIMIERPKSNLIWIDLEMSGLDPQKDVILELALIITDANLHVLHEGPVIAIKQPEYILKTMDPWCQKHHAASGLSDAVRSSQTTLEQAAEQTLAVIKKYCAPRTGLLAGNTVWMDRAFLDRYMPAIVSYLHYRLVDVTSIKQVVGFWYADDPHLDFKKTDSHRALPDIKESIEELQHYRNYFFK